MRLRAATLVCLLFQAAGTHAETLRYTYRFDASRLSLAGGTVQAKGLPQVWEQGKPEIPYEVVTLIVPSESRLVAVNARPVEERTFAEAVRLSPAAARLLETGIAVEPRVSRPELSKSGAGIYPAIHAEAAGHGVLHGYRTANVQIYPVRYDAASARLLVAETIEIEMQLERAGDHGVVDRERYSAAIEADARRLLEGLVANPEAIESYAPPQGLVASPAGRGFRPTQAPSLEGSPVTYVIITSAQLAPSFQVLADWKTRRGVPTVVRTLDWIEANYRHGSDIQESIRTFIRDAYAKWAVQYVLLGGDTDVIPARYGFSAFGPPTEQFIPTDMYYACLDGNWDADGDAVWGEPAPSPQNDGDDVDLFGEVFLGRLPVGTPAEAATVIGKIQAYENPASASYQNKLLLLGEVLVPVDWQQGNPTSLDGGQFSETLASYTGGCQTITKLYENSSNFPGSQLLSKQSALGALNAGYGFVNHVGHGFRYNMSCGDQSLVNSDVIGLANGSQRFVLYMMNCTAAAFDFPCLAEAYLESPGGAVAVFGASRAAFATTSQAYNDDFFQALYQQGFVQAGKAFVKSRLAHTGNAFYDNVDHYTHFLYNHLGDPEMVMHTCALGTTAASFPPSIGLGEAAVTVHVTVNGTPRADALVCLQKGVEEYVHAPTNANGDATLSFVAESAGSVQVTVSGQNMTTYQGTMAVGAGMQPYVHVASVSLDDDGLGQSAGNADAVLDAGEVIELSVLFRNDGTAASTPVTGVLLIDSPWATLQASAYSIGPVGAGGTANTTAPLRFTVNKNAPDGTVLPLRFESTNGTASWTDVVHKVVHAPILELTLSVIDDYAPGGNADGNVQAGETFDLQISFKNYGTGAADGLSASLASTDPDIAILAGNVQIGRADAMEEVGGITDFRLTELTLQENVLTLSLTDNYSRTRTQNITLRRPARPAAPELDAHEGAGRIHITWVPSADSDLYGYHVYRSDVSATGPWTRVTVDHTIRVSYFRDTGLAPSTAYFYRTTAIDQSGNESEPSEVATINTSPPQLAGWPIAMSASSTCPAAVGDIDGDGRNDVVAGSNHLYAWDWNGIELRDDDGDPATWGVFAQEINTITSAVLLADLDPHPGLEVFTTVWNDGNKAYVVRGDGSFPSGWPQNPVGGTAGYWGSPGAMDVDADDTPELFAPAKNGNLYAWRANGAPLGAAAEFKTGLGGYSRCSPTFANVDADAAMEIIYGAPNGTLYVWNADGSAVPHFPLALATLCLSSTAVGDVDENGVADIVMITEGGHVNVINTLSGTQLAGWPRAITSSSNPLSPSPALADFDFDGRLEIVVANNAGLNSQIRVFDAFGNVRPGWPQSVDAHTSESSPIVADVSGDGIPDVLFGNESGFIFGWDRNGVALDGFPLSVGDFVRATPWAGDVDGDADTDIVLVGWDRNVWIWDCGTPHSAAATQWPTFKHDVQRTGLYGYNVVEPPTDASEDGGIAARVPRQLVLSQNTPNPFNPSTTIEYGLPDRAAQLEVALDIFDARGRHIRRLVEAVQAAGTYRSIWDGRDKQAARVQSGVYFYRLRVGSEIVTRKMQLLK